MPSSNTLAIRFLSVIIYLLNLIMIALQLAVKLAKSERGVILTVTGLYNLKRS